MAWLDHLAQDVRSAARNLRKHPVACGVAIISLAGGIGATTATLILRDAVFRKPPILYRAPDQLSMVQLRVRDEPVMPIGHPVPGSLYAAWRDAGITSTIAAAGPTKLREVRTADRTETVGV